MMEWSLLMWKKKWLMNGLFLAGILGWEVCEDPDNGRLVEKFDFQQKRDCRTNLGNISCQKLDTEGQKLQQEHRNCTGEGQRRRHFTVLAANSTGNNSCREDQRLWGALNDFLVWVSLRFVEGVAVTFTLFGVCIIRCNTKHSLCLCECSRNPKIVINAASSL